MRPSAPGRRRWESETDSFYAKPSACRCRTRGWRARVLRNGNHAAIRRWRRKEALRATLAAGPNCCGIGARKTRHCWQNSGASRTGGQGLNRVFLIEEISKAQLKAAEAFEFVVGDTVRVHFRIVEGDKEACSVQGVVIALGRAPTPPSPCGAPPSTRRRALPLHSPRGEGPVVREGQVRRAKLYYLRDRRARPRASRRRGTKAPVAVGTAPRPTVKPADAPFARARPLSHVGPRRRRECLKASRGKALPIPTPARPARSAPPIGRQGACPPHTLNACAVQPRSHSATPPRASRDM